MKVKDGFWLREIAGANVAVPMGERAKRFSGVINLNETGALLFQKLQNGTTRQELTQALLDEYDTDAATAEKSVEHFLESLEAAELLIHDEH